MFPIYYKDITLRDHHTLNVDLEGGQHRVRRYYVLLRVGVHAFQLGVLHAVISRVSLNVRV